MHKRVIIQQCYFIKKQVVIRKNIINAKANKYQQNQTIYHRILLSSWKRKIIDLCEVSKIRGIKGENT